MSIEEIKEEQVVETPAEETPFAETAPVDSEVEEETGEEQEVGFYFVIPSLLFKFFQFNVPKN